MNIGHIKFGRELLVTQMNHCLFVAITITVMGLCGMDAAAIPVWLILGVVPVLLYIIRKKVHKFFLFFGLHLILPAAVTFLPLHLLVKLMALAIIVIYMVISIRIRLVEDMPDEEENYSSYVVIGGIGGLAIIQNKFAIPAWEKYYLYLVFFYLACYFIQFFVERYLTFLQVNDTSAGNIPKHAIFRSGLKQTAVCTAGAMCLFVLSANIEWLSYTLSVLGKGLLAVIRFLLSFMKNDVQEEIVETAQQSQGGGGGMGFMEPGETWLFWEVLERTFMVALGVALIILIVKTIKKVTRFLWDAFHKDRREHAEAVTDGIDVREFCEIDKKPEKGRKWPIFLDNGEKIRKIYYKRIIKDKVEIIGGLSDEELNYRTAKECCDVLSAEKLQEIYEKARYSKADVTKEDVKAAKAAVGK